MFYLKALVRKGQLEVTLLFPCRFPSSMQEEQVGDSPFLLFSCKSAGPVNHLILLLHAPGKAQPDPQ